MRIARHIPTLPAPAATLLPAPAAALALTLALCGRALADRALILGAPGFNDILRAFGPFHHFYRRALLAGEWPFWNPHLFAGAPAALFGQTGLFYPLNALTLAVPSWDAMDIQIALHLFLAFLLAHGAARFLGLGRPGALAAAAVWTLSGLMAGRIHEGHLTIIQALAWYPVGWAGLVATLSGAPRSRRGAALALTTIGFGAMGLTGAPQIWMFALIMAGATAATVLVLRRRETGGAAALRDAQAAAMALALAVALAAVEWLPIVLAGAHGARAALAPEFDPALLDFPLLQLVALPFPNFFGDPVHTEFAGPGLFGETLATPGAVALVLAAFWGGARREPTPLRGALVATAALALLLALGAQVGLYRWLEMALPPMRQVVGAGRFMFHVVWMLALGAGLGMEGVLARLAAGEPLAPLRRTARWLAAAGAFALVAGGLALAGAGPWNGALALAAVVRSGAFVGALALALAMIGRREWRPPVAAAVLLAVLALDLWTANARHFTSGPIAGPLPFPAELADHLADHTRGGRTQNVVLEFVNQSLIQGYEDVNGYGVNMPARFARMAAWSNGQPPRYGRQLVFNRSSPPFCHWFAVNTLIAYADQDDLPDPWERVWSDGTVALWRQPVAHPRARVLRDVVFVADGDGASLFDPPDPRLADTLVVHARPDDAPPLWSPSSAPAPLPDAASGDHIRRGDRWSGGTRTFQATLSRPGWLLIHETWDPGWRLRVNGRPAQVFRAQYCLMTIALEGGDHEVEMVFRPRGLAAGGGVSLLALTGWLALAVPSVVRFRRKDRSGATFPSRKASPHP